MVGKVAQKYAPVSFDWDFEFSADIIHPAAILRMDVSQSGIAYQRAAVTIADIFREIRDAS